MTCSWPRSESKDSATPSWTPAIRKPAPIRRPTLQTDKVPTVIEATHKPGPFVIDAAVTARPENSPVDVTRTAVARVLDLPGTASVEFGAATQSFDYEGSSDIDSPDRRHHLDGAVRR